VARAEPQQILRNVTDQIFETGADRQSKGGQFESFLEVFQVDVVAWFLSTAVGFWIMSWK